MVMTDITSKTLHEQTGKLLDRAWQGERFRVLCEGRPDAFLIPVAQSVDPGWEEIMAKVWDAAKNPGLKGPNAIVKERKAGSPV